MVINTQPRFPTLVAMLRQLAAEQPEKTAYSFLVDSENEPQHISYAELDRQARVIAAWLQEQNAAGERALLLYPPGLDYLAAFFGCLYAGTVAVPAYPPRRNRPEQRIRGIVADASAHFALTTSSILDNLAQRFEHAPDLAALRWLNTEQLPAGTESGWHEPEVTPQTVAFLQYTSGSTSEPKGVILTHSNLMHNLEVICNGFRILELLDGKPLATGVFWLPIYHDMGLIGGMLSPMYVQRTSVFMSPASFLQRPVRWLQAISEHYGVISGAPNFAYEVCVEKITPEQCEGLDLSRWRLAFCGAEPVRPDTLRRFAERFAPYGFRDDAFYPCYGLAEATLLVSGSDGGARPSVASIDRTALSSRRVVERPLPAYWETPLEALPADRDRVDLVSCGRPRPGQEVVIVNPETSQPCTAGEVGEIWIAGPSVARGYWNRPELTRQTFGAYLASGQGPYMRTGDFGFLHDGQLYPAGRMKDLIIIRGQNHYPQDIERTVEQSHPALQEHMGAAVSIDVAGEERLVLIYELKRQHRQADVDEIAAAVRQAVAAVHQLQLYALVLIRPLSIPKTSSGKVKRYACREGYLDGSLEVLGEWRVDQVEPMAEQPEEDASEFRPDRAQLERWLVEMLAATLKLPAAQIDVHRPFSYYGLDSAQAVSLSGELEKRLERDLPATLVWDYPTIAQLAAHLAGETAETAHRVPVVVSRPDHSSTPAREDRPVPVAIIGLGCRFPGAPDVDAFWTLLRDGLDAITEVPPDRWDAGRFFSGEEAVPGKMNTRWGGFLEQIDQFDPHFFGISPREAGRIDPQQRLLLEVAWEALEHAGIAPGRLAGSQTGVFVGISSYDYSRYQFSHPDLVDAYAGTGNAHSIAANRLSYLLDLRGPSLAIDTACSSSLVAIHQAVQSLRNGESDLALAGGVNAILFPEVTIFFSQARAMASDGRCKAFDARADGYVRSEGCGVVVLKRLDEALRDGDNVLAVIHGSAVNQDGRSNGLTAPNGPAQQAVIRRALQDARVEPAAISYVEAHGTGTPLGDPIEIQSLRAVLETGRTPQQALHVGSVKSNVGHLEAAAGIAGLIKTVLALQHKLIPPHLHFQSLNPHIALEDSPLRIPVQGVVWPRNAEPRLAGVSSFGFGGTNAHVIVGDYSVAPPEPEPAGRRSWQLLPLSGKSGESLRETVGRYAAIAWQEQEHRLLDVAYTAATGRDHHPHRRAVAASSLAQLHKKLLRLQERDDFAGQPAGKPRVAFLFTGAGPQYSGMGQSLYEREPTFRTVIDRCDELLRDELDVPLRSVLFPALFPPAVSGVDVNEITYTQPALFALEYALAQLWLSWGVRPDLVMGHSTGEYVAACVAGVFSLEDGLKLMAARGRLMGELPADGAMATIYADQEQVRAALAGRTDRLAIAATNGPENVVISGASETVEAVLADFAAQGIATQRLAISQAAHSPLVAPMLEPFTRVAETVTYQAPQIPLVTNLTGRIVRDEVLGLDHWQQHLLRPVQFAAGMQTLEAAGTTSYVEIGPQPSLLAMGRRCVADDRAAQWLPSLRRNRDDEQVLLESLGRLYEAGVNVNWDQLYAGMGAHKVHLPTTPFVRQRYWFGDELPAAGQQSPAVLPARPARHLIADGPSPAPSPSTGPRRLPTALPLYECPTRGVNLREAGAQLVQFVTGDLFGPGKHDSRLIWDSLLAAEEVVVLQAAATLHAPDSATIQLFGRGRPDESWQLLGSGQITRNVTAAPGRNGHSIGEKAGVNGVEPKPVASLAELLIRGSGRERQQALASYLHEVVAATLNMEPERLGRHQPLDTVGLDSLMAIEIKGRLEKELNISLPIVQLMEGPTIEQLAGQLLEAVDDPAGLPPVTPATSAGPHPLSYNQQALWFLHELLPAGVSFNVAGAVHLHGEVYVDGLRAAFAALYERHATLRLTFHVAQGRPVQQARTGAPPPFSTVDATTWDEETLRAYLVREAYRPFDLARGPIMRVVLLARPDGEYVLLLAMDHIIADLWSLAVLVREFFQLYQAEVRGEPAALEPLPLQYTDFVHWEVALVQSEAGQRMRDYWLKQLAGDLPALNLPTDRPRPAAQTFNGDIVARRLPAGLAAQLQELGQGYGATLYMTLLACFQALMQRYSGQDELLTGTVLAGRERPELAGLTGYFINPIALRADFSDRPSFVAFLQRVRRNVLDAVENQHYPLPLLAEQLQFQRDPGRPPLFETMFIMQKAQVLDGQPLSAFAPGMPAAQMELGGLNMTSIALPGMPAQFDLTLMVAEMEDGLGLSLHYNSDLFEAETMEGMLAHFEMLLDGVVADPERPLASVPLLPAGEREQVLRTWNATQHDFPETLCLHQLFEAQVQRKPEAPAVSGSGACWSYAELDVAAERLAETLRGLGVGPETLVGIAVSRRPYMMAGLLGILKAGGAYVPLDPAFPAERLAQMLEDARPPVLLTDEENLEAFAAFDVPALLCWRGEEWRVERGEAASAQTSAPVAVRPDNLAYVIYTSGSTGRPKGVQIPHRAVVNFLTSMAEQPGICADDALLAVTTLSFDIAALELFLPLAVGARVEIAPAEVAGDGEQLAILLETTRATMMQATPATWQMLLATGWSGSPHLRRLLCGGEVLPSELAGRLLGCGAELWNMYGPTETTIWSTTAQITDASAPITIGRPIGNTEIYILDEQMQPLPVGVPGDLYIGGAGVARGYLHRPELTAECFLPHPFAAHGRVYKTGDKARYRPDGSILFLGRDDQQVKVRGYRIELGDVEAALGQHPAGQPNVVAAPEFAPGDRRLVAYLLQDEARPAPPPEALRDFLRRRLPEYMIPAHFVFLEAFPLTPNGKVNRRALPLPAADRPELLAAYVPPRNELEEKLATILRETLRLERVGIHDNFFDLGGNSLLATQLIFQVNDQLGVHIPLRYLFAEPTVAGLSRAVTVARQNGHRPDTNGHHKAGLFGQVTLEQLKQDVVLDPAIAAGDKPPANLLTPEHVLLTGATGFLGAFLLHALLQRTEATVHCLVRAENEAAGLRRLRQNLESYGLWTEDVPERIVVVPGDLARVRLGLSAAGFERLAGVIDVIYHNGAMVNFVYPYQTHKGANVLGTQEVLRLAAMERIKAVHFVSTLSVLHTGEHDDGTVYGEEIDLEENGVPFGGYAQSKWVAEKLMQEAVRRGIPTAIYRPGLIAGDSESGVTNTGDMMSNLGRACLLLGAVPDLEVMVDVVPVDYVSAAIVHLSLREESAGQTFHLANPRRWAYGEMLDWFRERGFELELLPYETWRERLMTLARQLGGSEWGPFLPLLEEAEVGQVYMPAFDCQNTRQGLAGSDIRCAPVGPALLERYLSFFAEQGFVHG